MFSKEISYIPKYSLIKKLKKINLTVHGYGYRIKWIIIQKVYSEIGSIFYISDLLTFLINFNCHDSCYDTVKYGEKYMAKTQNDWYN